MNIIEAAKAMKKGKPVRRPNHPWWLRFFCENPCTYDIRQFKQGLSGVFNHWRIDTVDLLADDWMIVEDIR